MPNRAQPGPSSAAASTASLTGSPSSMMTETLHRPSSSGRGAQQGGASLAPSSPPPTQPRSAKKSLELMAWHAWIWLAGTMPLSMLESWELVLLALTCVCLTSLVWWSLYFHFPDHVRTVGAKSTYYLYGKLSPATISSDGVAAVANSFDRAADALVGQQRKRLTGEL